MSPELIPCAIFTNFSVHVACGRNSVLLRQGDEIPKGEGVVFGFLPHNNALYNVQHIIWTHTKTAEPIDAVWDDDSGSL